jgi:hypothetical protein
MKKRTESPKKLFCIGPFVVVYDVKVSIFHICPSTFFFSKDRPEGMANYYGTYEECILEMVNSL